MVETVKTKRRYWDHPICRQRQMFREYHHLTSQILKDIDKSLS